MPGASGQSKQEALERLMAGLQRLRSNASAPEFLDWRADVDATLSELFGPRHKLTLDLRNVSFTADFRQGRARALSLLMAAKSRVGGPSKSNDAPPAETGASATADRIGDAPEAQKFRVPPDPREPAATVETAYDAASDPLSEMTDQDVIALLAPSATESNHRDLLWSGSANEPALAAAKAEPAPSTAAEPAASTAAEPTPRIESAPRTDPTPRTESAPRTEPPHREPTPRKEPATSTERPPAAVQKKHAPESADEKASQGRPPVRADALLGDLATAHSAPPSGARVPDLVSSKYEDIFGSDVTEVPSWPEEDLEHPATAGTTAAPAAADDEAAGHARPEIAPEPAPDLSAAKLETRPRRAGRKAEPVESHPAFPDEPARVVPAKAPAEPPAARAQPPGAKSVGPDVANPPQGTVREAPSLVASKYDEIFWSESNPESPETGAAPGTTSTEDQAVTAVEAADVVTSPPAAVVTPPADDVVTEPIGRDVAATAPLPAPATVAPAAAVPAPKEAAEPTHAGHESKYDTFWPDESLQRSEPEPATVTGSPESNATAEPTLEADAVAVPAEAVAAPMAEAVAAPTADAVTGPMLEEAVVPLVEANVEVRHEAILRRILRKHDSSPTDAVLLDESAAREPEPELAEPSADTLSEPKRDAIFRRIARKRENSARYPAAAEESAETVPEAPAGAPSLAWADVVLGDHAAGQPPAAEVVEPALEMAPEPTLEMAVESAPDEAANQALGAAIEPPDADRPKRETIVRKMSRTLDLLGKHPAAPEEPAEGALTATSGDAPVEMGDAVMTSTAAIEPEAEAADRADFDTASLPLWATVVERPSEVVAELSPDIGSERAPDVDRPKREAVFRKMVRKVDLLGKHAATSDEPATALLEEEPGSAILQQSDTMLSDRVAASPEAVTASAATEPDVSELAWSLDAAEPMPDLADRPADDVAQPRRRTTVRNMGRTLDIFGKRHATLDVAPGAIAEEESGILKIDTAEAIAGDDEAAQPGVAAATEPRDGNIAAPGREETVDFEPEMVADPVPEVTRPKRERIFRKKAEKFDALINGPHSPDESAVTAIDDAAESLETAATNDTDATVGTIQADVHTDSPPLLGAAEPTDLDGAILAPFAAETTPEEPEPKRGTIFRKMSGKLGGIRKDPAVSDELAEAASEEASEIPFAEGPETAFTGAVAVEAEPVTDVPEPVTAPPEPATAAPHVDAEAPAAQKRARVRESAGRPEQGIVREVLAGRRRPQRGLSRPTIAVVLVVVLALAIGLPAWVAFGGGLPFFGEDSTTTSTPTSAGPISPSANAAIVDATGDPRSPFIVAVVRAGIVQLQPNTAGEVSFLPAKLVGRGELLVWLDRVQPIPAASGDVPATMYYDVASPLREMAIDAYQSRILVDWPNGDAKIAFNPAQPVLPRDAEAWAARMIVRLVPGESLARGLGIPQASALDLRKRISTLKTEELNQVVLGFKLRPAADWAKTESITRSEVAEFLVNVQRVFEKYPAAE